MVTKVNAIDNKIPSTRGLVTKIQFDSDKLCFVWKAEDVDKKVPNTSEQVLKTLVTTQKLKRLNNTQEFNRLIKIRFDVRMKEAVKSLASKS